MTTPPNPNPCGYCGHGGWVVRINTARDRTEPLRLCERCMSRLNALWRRVDEGHVTDFEGLRTKPAQCRKPPVFDPAVGYWVEE